MKMVSSLLVMVMMAFGFSASALDLSDIARGIAIAQQAEQSRNGRDRDHGRGHFGNPRDDRWGGRGNGDFSRPPRPGTGGQVTCSARDRGWEEHGGHGSCHECLRKHDRCIETCGVQYYVCRAEGTDRRGNRATFEGRAQYRFTAEDQAIYSCQNNRYVNCRVTSCSTSTETVSSRSCR